MLIKIPYLQQIGHKCSIRCLKPNTAQYGITKCLFFTLINPASQIFMSTFLKEQITHPPPPMDKGTKHSTLYEGNLSSRKKHCKKRKQNFHTESTSTCWRARYLSLRSFWNAYQRSKVRKIYRPQCYKGEINGTPNVQDLTHSSITSPSPTTRGPASSGGFLRASTAASASANWRFNFSKACNCMNCMSFAKHRRTEVTYEKTENDGS